MTYQTEHNNYSLLSSDIQILISYIISHAGLSQSPLRQSRLKHLPNHRNSHLRQTRDLKNILVKLRYVIVPKFNIQADPEGVK